MKVEQGKLIKMEYELRRRSGEVIESSASRGPITYVHGSGKMLPGLESRIEGLGVGAEKEGTIPAAEAFGDEASLPRRVIPRSDFPEGTEIKAGELFQASDADGNPVSFKVLEIEDDEITVRFDHPLAGQDIDFQVKILDITDPN